MHFRIKLRKLKYRFQDSLEDTSKKIPTARKKTLLVYSGAILVPVLVLAVFFYGEFNFSDLRSSLTVSEQSNTQEPTTEEDSDELKLKLTTRDSFLKSYTAQAARLPSAGHIYVSLSDILQQNDSNEILLPARNWEVGFEDIEATSVIAVGYPTQRVLYGKNISEVRSVASLTKLMTALVVTDTLEKDEVVTIPIEAIEIEGDSAGLVAGEQLTVTDLLHALLLESSNDAAYALKMHYDAKVGEEGRFEALMNQKAQELEIPETSFVEPSGLSEENVSTAQGIAKLLYSAYQNPDIGGIMSTSSYTARPSNKEITHFWVNTNALLDEDTGVVGGKTGYTEEAGPSMSVIARTPNDSGYVALVVLNAENRVEAARQLHEWVQKAYIWE